MTKKLNKPILEYEAAQFRINDLILKAAFEEDQTNYFFQEEPTQVSFLSTDIPLCTEQLELKATVKGPFEVFNNTDAYNTVFKLKKDVTYDIFAKKNHVFIYPSSRQLDQRTPGVKTDMDGGLYLIPDGISYEEVPY